MLVFHITVLQSLHLHQALNPQPYNGERKKIREKKNQLSLKIDFSLKKKDSGATEDGHSAQFLPYDSQLQLIFIKAFTHTQKKKLSITKWKKTTLMFPAVWQAGISNNLLFKNGDFMPTLCRRSWDKWSNVMYSVTDQLNRIHASSMELQYTFFYLCYPKKKTNLTRRWRTKSGQRVRQFHLTNFTQS